MTSPFESLKTLCDPRPRIAAVDTFEEYVEKVMAIYPPEIEDVRKGFTCPSCGQKSAEQVLYHLPYYGSLFQFECACGHVAPFRKGFDTVPAQPRDADIYDMDEEEAPTSLFDGETIGTKHVTLAPKTVATNGDGVEIHQSGFIFYVYSSWSGTSSRIPGEHATPRIAERHAWQKNLNGWRQAYTKRSDITFHS